jgi:hypothetical protein
MTLLVALLALAVAGVAAVRSTWSPCGLSMLSTITPFGERSRGHHYRTTAAWFVVGATVGGATLGTLAAALAAAVGQAHLSSDVVGTTALAATAVAALSDTGVVGVRVPIHRRQVNERWLDHYRAWVYGAGFGWQIGTGVATYVTSAAVYLTVVLATLTGSPVVALAVGTGFGFVRGLAVLLTRNLAGPTDLLAFHRRFAAAGPRAGHLVVTVEVGASVLLAAVVRTPAAITVVVAAAGLSGAGVALRRMRSRPAPDPTSGAGDEVAHEAVVGAR